MAPRIPVGILKENCLAQRPVGQKRFFLDDVRLELDNETVGFDSGLNRLLGVEPENANRDILLRAHETLVHGTVKIDKEADLTEEGIQQVRAFCAPRPGFKAPRYIFPLFVQIKFYNSMLPAYDKERKLFIQSSHRTYNVKSMAVESYAKSRNFLEGYQILHAMEDIVQDPECGNPPLGHRTPKWFVTHYIRRFKDTGCERREIYRYYPGELGQSNDASGNVSEPRRMNRLCSADVWGHFAAQAEWLLASQIAGDNAVTKGNPPLFDIHSWVKFCEKLPKTRKQAFATTGKRWGVPHGDESYVDKFGLERFGGSEKKWRALLETALMRQDKLNPNQEAPKTKPPRSSSTLVHQRRLRTYDSDFDASSTSEEEEEEAAATGLQHTIKTSQRLPQFLFHRPTFVPGRPMWYCPGEKCRFSLDVTKAGSREELLQRVNEHYLEHVGAARM